MIFLLGQKYCMISQIINFNNLWGYFYIILGRDVPMGELTKLNFNFK